MSGVIRHGSVVPDGRSSGPWAFLTRAWRRRGRERPRDSVLQTAFELRPRIGPKAVLLSIWPLLIAVTLMLTLSFAALWLTNAARAYVVGEGMWSKAQKDAVMHLTRYVYIGDDRYYNDYLSAMAVPLGDRRARLELEKAEPDYDQVYAGFLEGRNDRSDIPGMIALFRGFRSYPAMNRAIRLWTEGDAHIARIHAAALELRELQREPQPSFARVVLLVREVHRLNEVLTPVEDAFSESVNQASRELALLFCGAMVFLAIVLLGLGAALSRRMLARAQQAELRLLRANERLELAASGSNDGIWDWNLATHELYWSRRLRELLGYASDTEFRKVFRLRSGLHPVDRRRVLHALRSHLDHRSATFDIQFRLRCRHGGYKWFHARGKALWGVDGVARRFSGAMADITERKLAEQARQQAWELQYKTAAELDLALDGANVALWSYAPATGEILHARHWKVVLGHEVMPATIEGWQRLVHPEDRGHCLGPMRRRLDSGTAHYEVECRMQHADGHWVWLRSRGRVMARDAHGVPLHYAGVVMDISAQVAARRLEREQQQFLQAMIEGVDTGVMVSTGRRIIYINTSFRRMLGYEQGEALAGTPIADIIAAEHQALALQWRQKVLAGGKVPAGVLTMRTRHDETVRLAVNLSRIAWNGVPHIITTATLLSEHEMLEAHIHAANARFEQVLVSELEAQQTHIAHELHDSLGSVLAGVSLMLAGAKTLASANDRLRRHLDRAQDQVKSAAEMTRALARGLMPVGSHPGAFVQAVEQLTNDLSMVKSVVCELDTRGDFDDVPPEVGIHLYRIAQEAMSNAIRHGRATSIQIQLLDSARELSMRIEDNGRGFDMAEVGRGQPGVGLQSMMARAKAIGGTFHIARAADAGGCAVIVTWNHPSVDSTRDSGFSPLGAAVGF